jgi:hypothetical protein
MLVSISSSKQQKTTVRTIIHFLNPVSIGK